MPLAAVPCAGAEQERWSIRDLAQAFGVTPRAIRFYEDEGILTPSREGQNRIYSKADRARLAWILRARNVGFSLADIREMLQLYNLGDGRRTQRRVTLQKCRERLSVLQQQRADLDATIAELDGFVQLLEGLVAPAKSDAQGENHADLRRAG